MNLDKNNIAIRSNADRLRHALQQLAEEGAVVFRGRDLADQVGLDPAQGPSYFRRFAAEQILEPLGRGFYRLSRPGRRRIDPQSISLPPEAERVRSALAGSRVPALISGLDVLAPFQNQLPERLPILVIAERGSGAYVEDALVPLGYEVSIDPASRDMQLLGRLGDRVVIVRERSLDDEDPSKLQHRRRVEEAWVDLVAEARRGYPVAASELVALLRGLGSAEMSWPRLARSANRRNMPLVFAPDHRLPIEVKPSSKRDRFWDQIASEMAWQG